MSREEQVEAAWTLHLMHQQPWTNGHAMRRVMRRQLAEAQGWRCCYCGVRMNEILHHPSSASLEHVIPESRGGPTEEWNLAVACRACNYGRGDRYLAIETELERAQ